MSLEVPPSLGNGGPAPRPTPQALLPLGGPQPRTLAGATQEGQEVDRAREASEPLGSNSVANLSRTGGAKGRREALPLPLPPETLGGGWILHCGRKCARPRVLSPLNTLPAGDMAGGELAPGAR